MEVQLFLVMILTFVIYVISTLAYSVRVVGVKTGRIAVSFSVFNIFALISRMAVTFQVPLLAKKIESNINSGGTSDIIYLFRWVLFSATIASVAGALIMPTFIKIFSKAVESFSIYRSVPKLILHSFSKSGVEQFKTSLTIPTKENLSQLKSLRKVSKKIIALNVLAASISAAGSLSALYAGYIDPAYRTTCSSLAPVINGFSTILLFMFIDPYLSMMTDDVIRGECHQADFNRSVIFIVAGLIAGTLLAQAILIPASIIISMIAKVI